MNTPTLETERLILRRFTPDDLPAIYDIYSDRETNIFLPWFALTSPREAEAFYEQHCDAVYRQPCGYCYAVCLKSDNIPVGYVGMSNDDSRDFGYGLRSGFRVACFRKHCLGQSGGQYDTRCHFHHCATE